MERTTKLDLTILGIGSTAISGALLSIFFGQQNFDYTTGSPAYEAALAVCYALAGVLALLHFRQVIAVARRSRPLIAMIVLALASALWAENPSLALRRSLALAGGTLIGVLLAVRFNSRDRLRFLSFLFRTLALSSLIFAIFLPKYGISDDLLHPGSWTGVFNNKNQLGTYMALAFLVDSLRTGRIRDKLPWFALYLLLLVKSQSASPLAGLAATWVIAQIFIRMRRRHRLTHRAIVLSISASITVGLTAGLGSGLFQAVLGRSTDLSGRGELWSALVPTIFMHPMLGYGYGAFWAGGSKQYYEVARQISWAPMYAHNGYLEIMVSLGLVGLILGCWFLWEGGLFSARRADLSESPEDFFPLALIIYSLIRNTTEVTLLYHNNLDWAVLVATVLSVLPGSPDLVRIAPIEQQEDSMVATEEYA